jgi:hypothetical protein
MAQLHVREGRGRESRAGGPVAGPRRICKPRLERLEARCLPGFLAPLAFDAGTLPWSVAVGDFNGDGKPDLAVANLYSNNVSVLLGQGDGTFQSAVNYPTGNTPAAVAVGDFNGDGNQDLAVANYGGNNVSVLLGKGDGTFLPAQSFPGGGLSVAVGDFNGDGNQDLAVANYGGVSVLLGKGDGTFQAAQTIPGGKENRSLAVGDFNGDGHLDLAVADYGDGWDAEVWVVLGHGDGSFGPAQSVYDGGLSDLSVTVGDFNGDGIPDLAVAAGYGTSVLLGKGDGSFQPAVNYTNGGYALSVAVGDFNGDGIPDLAVANLYSNTVSVLLGQGDGTFQPAQSYAAGYNPSSVAVGDFNGDGWPDLAAAAGTVSILLNDATWSMSPTGAADRRVDSGPKGPAPPSLSLRGAAVAASATGQPPGTAPGEAAPPAPGLAPGLIDALFAAPRGEEPARAAPGLVVARHAALSHTRWQPLFDDLDLPGQARAPLPGEEL